MSDEAVRKELTVGMVERIIRLRFKKHGEDARLDNILAQFRSAAIQECADKMRAMNHPAYADMILLALKER